LHVSADRLLSLRKFGSWTPPDAISGVPSSPPTSTTE
jgi:hypothetical protein